MAEASDCFVRMRKATRVAFTNGHVLTTTGNTGALLLATRGSEKEAVTVEKLAPTATAAHKATSAEPTEQRKGAILKRRIAKIDRRMDYF